MFRNTTITGPHFHLSLVDCDSVNEQMEPLYIYIFYATMVHDLTPTQFIDYFQGIIFTIVVMHCLKIRKHLSLDPF